MVDLKLILSGLSLAHPVLPAPGPNTAGAAEAVAAVRGGAPAVLLQTVTLDPGERSDPARIAYGKESAFHREPCSPLPFAEWLATEFPAALQAAREAGVPCIPAIGYGAGEVVRMGEQLAQAGVDALFYDTHHARREEILPALQALKMKVKIPVIVRLAPHHGDDLAELAAQLEPWADGFCVIGSFGPTLLIDAERGTAALPGGESTGYLSGEAIRPITRRFVFELARRVSKPVIAAGGASSGIDVAEYLMLGAAAVMLSTHAVRKGPGVYGRMATELEHWLGSHGYPHLGAVSRAYLRKYGHGQRVVTEKEESPQLIAERCITCTLCETVCFYDAVSAPPKRLPVLTEENCFACGLCVSACPAGALTFRPRDQVTMLPAEGV